jgi:uncharacterized phage protein (TIGR01671 family)
MSREIKFRAWDKDRKMMAYEIEQEYDTIAGIVFQGTEIEPGESSFASYLDDDAYVVMQYTGLKDKNGKGIYEGDITNEGVVEWCDCLAYDGRGAKHSGFYFKDKYAGEYGELNYHKGFYEDIEVIGNVHENPELLG